MSEETTQTIPEEPVVTLQEWIDEHINRRRPVYSIKAVGLTGSAELPLGKHLRLKGCEIDELYIEGDRSVVVIQNSTIKSLIAEPGTILYITDNSKIDEATLTSSKINIDTSIIKTMELYDCEGHIIECPIEEELTISTNSIIDIGGMEMKKLIIEDRSVVRVCGGDYIIEELQVDSSEVYVARNVIYNLLGVESSKFKIYNSKIKKISGDLNSSEVLFQEVIITEEVIGQLTSSSFTIRNSTCADFFSDIKDVKFLAYDSQLISKNPLTITDSLVKFQGSPEEGLGELSVIGGSFIKKVFKSTVIFESISIVATTIIEEALKSSINFDSMQLSTQLSVIKTSNGTDISFNSTTVDAWEIGNVVDAKMNVQNSNLVLGSFTVDNSKLFATNSTIQADEFAFTTSYANLVTTDMNTASLTIERSTIIQNAKGIGATNLVCLASHITSTSISAVSAVVNGSFVYCSLFKAARVSILQSQVFGVLSAIGGTCKSSLVGTYIGPNVQFQGCLFMANAEPDTLLDFLSNSMALTTSGIASNNNVEKTNISESKEKIRAKDEEYESQETNISSGKKENIGGSKSTTVMGDQSEVCSSDRKELVASEKESTYGSHKTTIGPLGDEETTLMLGNKLIQLLLGDYNLELLLGNVTFKTLIGNAVIESFKGDVSMKTALGNALVQTLKGDVTVETLLGNILLNTLKGDIDIKTLAGNIALNTVKGDVSLESLAGNIILNTLKGNIEGGTLKGNVDLSTKLGDVVFNTKVGNAELSSAAGNVLLETKVGNIDAKTAAGNIILDTLAGNIISKTLAGNVRLSTLSGVIQLSAPGPPAAPVVTQLTSPVIDLITGVPQIGVPTVLAGL